jgi:hypothetical protein
MYQVTAIWGHAEVGYGESHSMEDAMLECIESVPVTYPPDDVVLVCRVSMADAMVPA